MNKIEKFLALITPVVFTATAILYPRQYMSFIAVAIPCLLVAIFLTLGAGIIAAARRIEARNAAQGWKLKKLPLP